MPSRCLNKYLNWYGKLQYRLLQHWEFLKENSNLYRIHLCRPIIKKWPIIFRRVLCFMQIFHKATMPYYCWQKTHQHTTQPKQNKCSKPVGMMTLMCHRYYRAWCSELLVCVCTLKITMNSTKTYFSSCWKCLRKATTTMWWCHLADPITFEYSNGWVSCFFCLLSECSVIDLLIFINYSIPFFSSRTSAVILTCSAVGWKMW